VGTAEKLLQKLRQTKAGWSDRELFKLMTGYGFLSREGNHTVYSHTEHSDLRLVVPRGRELKKVYLREAEKLIDEVLERDRDKGADK